MIDDFKQRFNLGKDLSSAIPTSVRRRMPTTVTVVLPDWEKPIGLVLCSETSEDSR